MELPNVSTRRTLAHVTNPITPVMDTLSGSLYPELLRRRFSPPRHQADTEEIDRELLITEDKDSEESPLADALVKKPNTIEDEKEDARSRLNELTTFALVGSGLCARKVGTGTYNRERKSTVFRQDITDRDSLWGPGIRAPPRGLFSNASAALTWGCLQASNVPGYVALLSDFHPKPQESYDPFAPTGKKYGPRNKKPDIVDLFLRCDKRHIGIRCMIYGKEHRAERIHDIHTVGRLREAHADLFTIPVLVSTRGEMTLRYIALVAEGARMMLRMLPGAGRKGEFMRNALTPMADGRSRWEYPTASPMERTAGFWQSIEVPRLEWKASRNTRPTFLGTQPERSSARG